jgi:O-antigen/teichoic acid export membrane protein
MIDEKRSYLQIMKATSLFGGVQIFNILIGIIRSKIVAVLLGTAGMGILGLYTATLSLIQSIIGLGLSVSAVRDISEANGTGDAQRIAAVIKTLRRCIWATGILGSIITMVLAPWLSKWTFGNENYSWSFVWLSVICLLTAISNGQNVLLQGMRHLQQMAKSTLYGSILGLFTSLPLYYFFGVKGIVPSLIVAAMSSLGFSYYFARQISVQRIEQKWGVTYHSGLSMAKLGFVMMLSGFMVALVSYVINLFISNKGGVPEVGLYRAGWNITNQYTGLIFTAMATDYYPRLAAINNDNEKLSIAVNQQAEISVLLLGPMLVALIGFVPLVVHLFYTVQFMPITNMIKWNMMGMLFKAASWAMAFIIVAKGDNRLYFVTEIVGNTLILIFNLVGYSLWGLDGIGISFAASYLTYFLLVSTLVKKRYGVFYHDVFWKLFLIQNVFIVTMFVICLMYSSIIVYILAGILFAVSSGYSLKELNKRMNLKSILYKSS